MNIVRANLNQRTLGAALCAALPLVSLAWALDLFRAVGLNLYAEQVLALMLAIALALAFFTRSASGANRRGGGPVPFYDYIAAAAGFAAAGYVAFDYGRIFETLYLRPLDAMIAGFVIIALTLEALRRTAGAFLAGVVAVFLVYALVGHMVPGALQGRNVAFDRLVVYLSIDSNGMMGMPLMVTATAVVMFILFGALLTQSGGGRFFTDLSMASMGKYRGGSAKIAIVASALFGSISGSAVANVASTGVVTIPLMKDGGYRGRVAGAIESVASTGGQLMPPVMGASAFLMAEFLQIGYGAVVLAALIPALLYFLAVFIQADLIAARDGITAIPAKDIPRSRAVLKAGWYFFAPFAVLIGALFWLGMRPEAAAFWAAVSVTPLGLFLRYKGEGLSLASLWDCFVRTGEVVTDIVLIGAAAGIIIGVLNITSLGFALSLEMVNFAGGSLVILLIMSALLSVVLGMGMPTVGVYILLAALVAPSLVELGVHPISAHLFVLYFGMMSMITPPVAIAAFTAAVIAKSPPLATSVQAIKLGWTAYVIPFVFVFQPEILMNGSTGSILIVTLRVALGVWLVSACVVGRLFTPLSGFKRWAYFCVGALSICPTVFFEKPGLVAICTLSLGVSCIAVDLWMSRQSRNERMAQ